MTAAATEFLKNLRQETEPFHTSIEQLPLSAVLVSEEVTLEHYGKYLSVFYGFVKEFETHIYPKIQTVVNDLESRKKTALLISDLQSLGIEPDEIDTFDSAFFKQNHTLASALSCMYVLEGSTLGGQLISKHLQKTLGEPVAGSLNYLKAYTTKTGSMWKGFLETFCEVTVSHHQQEEAIKGAVKSFALLEKWMIEQSAVPSKA